ncbi:MAG: Fur family transcriptional regulator [Bilifractor sp.]|jgi:Fur family peroxide stress response transcriptional regulator
MTLKYSRQRESIKTNLLHRTDHPTADMVYADIRKIYPNISLGTVYRNLGLLSDLGEITRLATLMGADRYDGNTTPHSHFVCKRCGKVIDVHSEVPPEIMKEAQEDVGGSVEACSVTFYGICKECLEETRLS